MATQQTKDDIRLLAAGNFGALSALTELSIWGTRKQFELAKNSGMIGPQFWVLYADACGGNIWKFIHALEKIPKEKLLLIASKNHATPEDLTSLPEWLS